MSRFEPSGQVRLGSDRRRWLIASGVAAAHGAALALIGSMPDWPAPRERFATISVFNVSADQAKPETAPPRAETRATALKTPLVPSPADPAATSEAVNVAPPSDAFLQAVAGLQGERCDLLAAVQRLVRDEPEALRAVASVPRSERSVANAIMMWDGHWSEDERLAPIRTMVAALVVAAPEACRLEMQAGPRLVALGPIEEATMLVLGSGAWRWQDMAPPPVEQDFVQVASNGGSGADDRW